MLQIIIPSTVVDEPTAVDKPKNVWVVARPELVAEPFPKILVRE
jgi:hypothetical protein